MHRFWRRSTLARFHYHQLSTRNADSCEVCLKKNEHVPLRLVEDSYVVPVFITTWLPQLRQQLQLLTVTLFTEGLKKACQQQPREREVRVKAVGFLVN
jgi:hypothetical protein